MNNYYSLKAAIVDGEQHFINELESSLDHYCPEIVTIGGYTSISETLLCFDDPALDLLFMDVHLFEEASPQLLLDWQKKDLQMIFTISYLHYSPKLRSSAQADYLLKPINPPQLKAQVNKVLQLRTIREAKNSFQACRKIPFPTQQGLLFKDPHEIIRCEADGAYTKVMTANEVLMISKNIKTLELLLAPHGFFRVHKSHLINLHHLCRYIKGSGGEVVMSDGSSVLVSKRKRELFLNTFT